MWCESFQQIKTNTSIAIASGTRHISLAIHTHTDWSDALFYSFSLTTVIIISICFVLLSIRFSFSALFRLVYDRWIERQWIRTVEGWIMSAVKTPNTKGSFRHRSRKTIQQHELRLKILNKWFAHKQIGMDLKHFRYGSTTHWLRIITNSTCNFHRSYLIVIKLDAFLCL